MKKFTKISFVVIIILVAFYLTFYGIIPYYIVKPTPLYCIKNEDSKTHNVTIEVREVDRILLRKEYVLNSGDVVCYERCLGWYPKVTPYLITWSEGRYTFVVYLDGQFATDHATEVSMFKIVYVTVYGNSVYVGEMVV